MQQDLVIPVQKRRWPFVLSALFFGPGAYVLFFVAMDAVPGEAPEAWIAFACCAAIAIVSFAALVLSFFSQGALVIGRDEVVLPKNMFSRTPPRFRYADITTLNEVKLNGQRMLAVRTRRKSYSIHAMLLPRFMPLDEVRDEIERRVSIARGIAVR